jgi:hypothetical protein
VAGLTNPDSQNGLEISPIHFPDLQEGYQVIGKLVGVYKVLCVLFYFEASVDGANDKLHIISYYIYMFVVRLHSLFGRYITCFLFLPLFCSSMWVSSFFCILHYNTLMCTKEGNLQRYSQFSR